MTMSKSSLVIFCVVALVACYDVDEFEQAVRHVAQDERYTADFYANIESVLKIEPDYFNFTLQSGVNFKCDFGAEFDSVKQDERTVHQLRPRDIEIVAAMGDSITAGCGENALTPLGLLIEYRARTWSIGGQSRLERVFSVPNILKKFNPHLKGFNRIKDTSLLLKKGVGLNAAVSGNKAKHMPEQAKRLVTHFKESGDMDKWKMVTLFIGGNDLCASCNKPDEYSPISYVENLRKALDILHADAPKTLVNLVQVVNVTDLRDMNKGLVCSFLHTFECPCAAYPKSVEASQELERVIQGYYDRTRELVNSGRYDTRDDFTVVLQPFLEDFVPPRLVDGAIDFSYLAPDCFHFSVKGHALMALGLWNNMLQPVGKKATNTYLNDKPLCPTPNSPYIFTNKNSV